eukprot:5230360-Alexandrium_andersonii.AAC.1
MDSHTTTTATASQSGHVPKLNHISVLRRYTTLPPFKAPHVMSPLECKCAGKICTGAARGFYEGWSNSVMQAAGAPSTEA